MMQVTGGEIVDMIPVRDGRVSTAGSVNVTLSMARAAVRRCTCRRVGGADLENALVHVSVVDVVEVPVVQVVDVTAVLDGEVAAVGAVEVGMVRMGVVAHGLFLFLLLGGDDVSGDGVKVDASPA
jgi:hypothetical protein